MSIKPVLAETEEHMKKTIDKVRTDFASVRTGRASAALVEGIRVEYYGSMVPLNQVASVSAPEARTLEIRPWDKAALAPIERAILQSNIGVTPGNDGSIIRIQIPRLTEERRKDLIKVIRKMAEEFRVTLRNERRDAVERLKKMKDIPEDDRTKGEQDIQKITDLYVKKVDEMLTTKEQDVLEV